MRGVLVHLSGFAGLLVLLNQLWNSAELERTIILAFSTGVAVYAVLTLGYAAVKRILEHTPPDAPGGTREPEGDGVDEGEERAATDKPQSTGVQRRSEKDEVEMPVV